MKPAGETPRRLDSIDALRGAVMIVMALDHVRDFIHRDAMVFSPTDLRRTSAILFLTRWVTHFCAPVFLLLAGAGAFFWWHRRGSRSALSSFLLTRGLWLILLELTVMRFAYNSSFSMGPPVLLVIIWVIGACMVGMAALIWLPQSVLAVLSLATILLHNLLDPIRAADVGPIWNVLHQPGAVRLGGWTFIVSYPTIPWIAVMAAGFCLARVYQMEAAARRRLLAAIGVAATLSFVALRALNRYGDPVPWSHQPSMVFTALSFLNCTKYPPSVDFLLMTLGPALIALACLDGVRLKAGNPLLVFGRVPLFYFVLHFYLARIAAALLAWMRYGHAWFTFQPLPSTGGPREAFPPDFGYSLGVTYVVWAGIVIALYPVCRWFAGVKARRRDWWLSYL